MDFRDFIKEQRLKKGVSIYRLAKLTGISTAQLLAYESHKNQPPIQKADAICKALEINYMIGVV